MCFANLHISVCLYKLVSTNVKLKETILYGKSSVELSRNANKCGMGIRAKKVRLGMFLDPIPPKELSDDPQLVEQIVISVQNKILTSSVLISPCVFPPDFCVDQGLLLGCSLTFG